MSSPKFYVGNREVSKDEARQHMPTCKEMVIACSNVFHTPQNNVSIFYSTCIVDPTAVRELLDGFVVDIILTVCKFAYCECTTFPDIGEHAKKIYCSYLLTKRFPEQFWGNIRLIHPYDIIEKNVVLHNNWWYSAFVDDIMESEELIEEILKTRKLSIREGFDIENDTSMKINERIADHNFDAIEFRNGMPHASILSQFKTRKFVFVFISGETLEAGSLFWNLSSILNFAKRVDIKMIYTGIYQNPECDIASVIPPDIYCPNLMKYKFCIFGERIKIPILEQWCADNRNARFTRTKAIMPE